MDCELEYQIKRTLLNIMLTQSFGDSVATNEGCLFSSRLSNSSEVLLFVADNVTALEFDPSGNYLATGDRGGRIVIFKSEEVCFHTSRSITFTRPDSSQPSPKRSSKFPVRSWSPYFQFQSHEAEFDYLKSLEIEERIGHIKFCPSVHNQVLLLSSNGTLTSPFFTYAPVSPSYSFSSFFDFERIHFVHFVHFLQTRQ